MMIENKTTTSLREKKIAENNESLFLDGIEIS
jgi:hypothetical protein